MNPAQAIRSVYRQYVGVQGRASRSEFWWFTLFWFVVAAALGGLQSTLKGPLTDTLTALFVLGSVLPQIAVAARRLHDTGRSGFWMFIGLVPLVGSIVLIIFYVLPSQPGANKYGPRPGDAELDRATAPIPSA